MLYVTKEHVHKYEAVFGSFVDIGIVVTFLSFAWILSFMKQSFLTLSCINYLSGNIICQKIDNFVTML